MLGKAPALLGPVLDTPRSQPTGNEAKSRIVLYVINLSRKQTVS